MDRASRHVLAWRLSNTLDTGFCTDPLEEALTCCGAPAIINTDQGSQFTGMVVTGCVQAAGIRIPIDGRGLPGETPVDMMDKPPRALPTSPQAQQQQQQQDRFKGIPAA